MPYRNGASPCPSQGGDEQYRIQPTSMVLAGDGRMLTNREGLKDTCGEGRYFADGECCQRADKDTSETNFRKATTARMPRG